MRPALEALCFSGFVVGHGAIDAVVNAPRVEVSLKLHVDGLGMAPVKPQIQFLPLLRRERVYCAFDLLYRA
jgi:hypothetical protein